MVGEGDNQVNHNLNHIHNCYQLTVTNHTTTHPKTKPHPNIHPKNTNWGCTSQHHSRSTTTTTTVVGVMENLSTTNTTTTEVAGPRGDHQTLMNGAMEPGTNLVLLTI